MSDSKRKPGKTRTTRDSSEPAAAESISFEGALERLEQTVSRLEEGDMPLEEALALFESGVKLSRICHETLEAAERRIEILVADGSAGAAVWTAERFEPEDEIDPEEGDDLED